jgi:CHASE3 domain sensor protein
MIKIFQKLSLLVYSKKTKRRRNRRITNIFIIILIFIFIVDSIHYYTITNNSDSYSIRGKRRVSVNK